MHKHLVSNPSTRHFPGRPQIPAPGIIKALIKLSLNLQPLPEVSPPAWLNPLNLGVIPWGWTLWLKGQGHPKLGFLQKFPSFSLENIRESFLPRSPSPNSRAGTSNPQPAALEVFPMDLNSSERRGGEIRNKPQGWRAAFPSEIISWGFLFVPGMSPGGFKESRGWVHSLCLCFVPLMAGAGGTVPFNAFHMPKVSFEAPDHRQKTNFEVAKSKENQGVCPQPKAPVYFFELVLYQMSVFLM